jgi:quinol monooxygenase YgiN
MQGRSVLYLKPKPGCRQAVIDEFIAERVPERALQQAGCLAVELLAPPDEDAPLVVIALWNERADYDGWLNSPVRAQASSRLDDLLTEPPSSAAYDVLVSATA